jgi:ABC-type phosphate transport system permease subunit
LVPQKHAILISKQNELSNEPSPPQVAGYLKANSNKLKLISCLFYIETMSEISRFFGIIIAIYFNEHGTPHFHAKYGGIPRGL